MIDLYGMGSPNVVKVAIALEEMRLAHTIHPVDVFGGAQFDPAFLKLNPLAKVPVIVDHDAPGEPLAVFESGAILIYLAEKTGQFLPTAQPARIEALQWLMVQMTGQGPMTGQLVHFTRFAPGGNDYALSRYKTQVHRFYETLDARLASVPYVGGAEYTIADIATFPWARTTAVLAPSVMEPYKHVAAWVARLNARPAVTRATAAMEEVRAKVTPFDKAAPEELDRVFGRGRFAA